MFRRSTPYLYLLGPLALLGLFFMWPVVMAFGMSLLDYGQDLYHPQFLGGDNYTRLLSSQGFWSALGHTAFLTMGLVPALCTVPIILAVLLNGQLPGIRFFRTVVYIPVITSAIVVGIAWKWLYAEEGLLNYLLSGFHLPKVGWLINPQVALWAVMLVIFWKAMAYYMMMFLSQLQSVPQELYQAAEMDGANTWQKHWHVTLPHLRPTIAMVAIISTIGSLKIFPEVYVMTQGGPVGATQTLVYYLYQRAFENLDLGLACAAGFVLMALLLGLSMLQMKLSGKETV